MPHFCEIHAKIVNFPDPSMFEALKNGGWRQNTFELLLQWPYQLSSIIISPIILFVIVFDKKNTPNKNNVWEWIICK